MTKNEFKKFLHEYGVTDYGYSGKQKTFFYKTDSATFNKMSSDKRCLTIAFNTQKIN